MIGFLQMEFQIHFTTLTALICICVRFLGAGIAPLMHMIVRRRLDRAFYPRCHETL